MELRFFVVNKKNHHFLTFSYLNSYNFLLYLYRILQHLNWENLNSFKDDLEIFFKINFSMLHVQTNKFKTNDTLFYIKH